MKSIILFASALVLILGNSAFTSGSLEDTCKKVQAGDPDSKYEFCVTSLQVVPESRTANLSQLTIITTQLSIKNFTHALGVIAQLLKNHSLSHLQREVLETCQEVYNYGVDANKQAIEDVKAGDIFSASSNLSAAADAPVNCEDAFSEAKEASLLPREDDLASKISNLALGILALLKS
ncbi:putative invertase inhibitor [Ananas comosus]|uniref:Putative invertase inhibitor n=1 Tax=Ananas comosus TaxID=4615 RepID=A0A199VS31_ANACO|nr:putative invertase inhibitor [Ananas comosus]